MYLYTPNPDMLAEFNAARNKHVTTQCGVFSRICLRQYSVQKQSINGQLFRCTMGHTKFYSRVRRDTIPVDGITFPREFFKETVVGESK